jgi:hypothetical protein
MTAFHIDRWKQARTKEVSRTTELLRESPVAAVDNYRTDDTRVGCLTDDGLRTVLAITDTFVTDVCRADYGLTLDAA